MEERAPTTIIGIQLLRAVAALAVVSCHLIGEFHHYGSASRLTDNLAAAGTSGVDLFFVISGFVMMQASFGSGRRVPEPGVFLWRRVTRIYPLYWCVLAVTLTIRAIGFLSGVEISIPALLSAVALAPVVKPVVMVSWTLTYELLFYLIFAATLALRSATAATVLTTAGITIILLLGPAVPNRMLADFLGYTVMAEFCFGLAVGWLALRLTPKLPPLLMVPLFALVLLVPWIAPHAPLTAPEPRFLLWGPVMAAIVVCAAGWSLASSPAVRLGLLLGDASYAIYLIHPLTVVVLGYAMRHQMLPGWALWPAGLLAFGGSVAAGVIAHLAIERPLLEVMRRRRARAALTVARA